MIEAKKLMARAYAAFNRKDADGVLDLMADDVSWPKASEGGRVTGKEEIREYWTRQWKQFSPDVKPVEVIEDADGKVKVRVHQVVRTLNGEVVSDSEVWHVYSFVDGLIVRMELKDDPGSTGPTAAFSRH